VRTLSPTLLVTLACAGCAPVEWAPVIGEVDQVVPGAGLPPETPFMESNNNVGIWLDGDRLLMGWRSAPTHFAGPDAVMHVVSSTDLGQTWEFEATWALGSDVREPLFYEVGGTLFFTFFQGGTDSLAFEPQQMWRAERFGVGDYGDLEPWGEEQEVPWEVVTRDDVAWLTSYHGEHYDLDAGLEPVELRLGRSTDGRTWDQTPVYSGGASEAAFQFDPDGRLWAILRNEDGDATGFGSLLCTAEPADYTDWDCPDVSDPERYDSPRMFVHEGELWLVARRDIGGPYDQLLTDLPFEEQRLENLTAYSGRPKRTALYRIDRESRAVVHVEDLPSAGDTSFPSVVQLDDHRFLVANYTSPLDEPDITWLQGQISDRGTLIYLVEISFEPAD